MIQMANQMWEILINTVEALFFLWFMKNKLLPKNTITNLRKKQYIFLLSLIILLSFMNHYNVSTLVTILLFFVLHIVFTFCFFSSPVFVQIFWVTVYSVLAILADEITFLIPCTFAKVDITHALQGGFLRVPITLLYVALLGIFIFFIIHFTKREIFLTGIEKVSFFLLSIISIAIAHYMLIVTLNITSGYEPEQLSETLGIICFLFLILFLLLVLFIYRLGISRQQNIHLVEEGKQQELERQQFHNILNSTEELRKMKHDMKIHLNVLENLARNNNNEKLLEYLSNYKSQLEQVHKLITTGNIAIDCIVSSKLVAARNSDIIVNYTIHLPDIFPLDDVSLCSLIGNLFDNAIEACREIPVDKNQRWINFMIQPYRDMVVICIENSYDGKFLTNENGQFISRKKGSSQDKLLHHGLGLKRIEEIVYQAAGMVHTEATELKFVQHILLPLQEKES